MYTRRVYPGWNKWIDNSIIPHRYIVIYTSKRRTKCPFQHRIVYNALFFPGRPFPVKSIRVEINFYREKKIAAKKNKAAQKEKKERSREMNLGMTGHLPTHHFPHIPSVFLFPMS
jgi:hypothetical protein